MSKYIYYFMIILITASCKHLKQYSSERVDTAVKEKQVTLEQNLQEHNLDKKNINILFVAYKELDELHVYAKSKQQTHYQKIKSYPICKRSGKLGPKKAEGDKQVPEGIYHIDRFNPHSSYYLSLGINYPNDLDKILGYTGSDIFIHGKCETVGCLPMTDEGIKEIYLYALWASQAGQTNIPVYLFPFEMTNENIEKYASQVDEKTVKFWKNLQQGYLNFQKNNSEILFTIDSDKYLFQ